MGSLSLKTTNNKTVIMDNVKAAVLQKRGDFSDIENSAFLRPLYENETSKWNNIKIQGRNDDSADSNIQSDGSSLKDLCSGYKKYIDFSLHSRQKQESCAVSAENVTKSDLLHSSEKHKSTTFEELEPNLGTEKGSTKVKEEPSTKSYLSGAQSESGPCIDRDEKCIYSKIFISKRRSVTKEEKDRAFQAARAFVSNNPFFTVVMRPTHVYRAFYMSIPSSFVRAHLASRTRDMTLEISDTRQWPVHCTFRKDYAGLRKGWSTFVWENNLEEGDACVFERIDGNAFTLRVHIFRVLEEIVPLTRSYMPYTPKVPRAIGRKRMQQLLDHPRITDESDNKGMV